MSKEERSGRLIVVSNRLPAVLSPKLCERAREHK